MKQSQRSKVKFYNVKVSEISLNALNGVINNNCNNFQRILKELMKTEHFVRAFIILISYFKMKKATILVLSRRLC